MKFNISLGEITGCIIPCCHGSVKRAFLKFCCSVLGKYEFLLFCKTCVCFREVGLI